MGLEEDLKPAEIAAQTGRDVRRVYQVIRNIRRRLIRARQEQDFKDMD